MNAPRIALLALLALAIPARSPAATYIVNAATGNDSTGTGSAAKPFRTITRALAVPPKPGDRIYVSGGTYNAPLGEAFPLPVPPAVRIEGAGASTTFVAGNSGRPVFEISQDASYVFDSRIEKLTIRGGLDGIRVFAQLNRRVEPAIRGCTIESNARYGVHVSGQGVSVLRTSGNTIRSNGQWGVFLDGTNGKADVSMEADLVTANGPGGGIYLHQPVRSGDGTSGLRGVRLHANRGDGLRVVVEASTPPPVTNCVASKNTGAGVAYATTTVYNWQAVPLEIVGSTIADNAVGLDLAKNYYATQALVLGSIVWGNGDDLGPGFTGRIVWSDIGEGAEGRGNFSADPRFADRARGDYRLAAGSPCVDAGAGEAPIEIEEEEARWTVDFAVPDRDLAGALRQDIPGVPNRGRGVRPWVDVGAYEQVLPGAPSYPTTWHVSAATGSDVTGNGTEASPFRSITRALRAPRYPGNVVRVAAGTYSSASGETFPILVPPETRIAGAGMDATTVRGVGGKPVFEFSDEAPYGESSVLEGFTIREGQEGVLVKALTPDMNPRIRDNRIEANSWNGVRLVAGHVEELQGYAGGQPVLSGNEIRGNAIWGLYVQNDRAVYPFLCCMGVRTYGNTVTGNGPGGGVYLQDPVDPVLLRDDRLRKNTGDGLRISALRIGSRPVLTNAIITGNTGNGAFLTTQAYSGSQYPFQPIFRNATIADNAGSGLHVEGTVSARVWNSVLWGNRRDVRTVALPAGTPDLQMFHTDTGVTGSPFCKTKCISLDPAFPDRSAGDYHLSPASPCVDRGSSEFPYTLYWDAGSPLADADARPRFDHPTVPNRGAGEMPFWDLGAFEAAVPAGVAFPATWRVAGSGNDTTGDGSSARPFRTITRALQAPYYPGNTIEVRAGTYDSAAGEVFPIPVPRSVTIRGPGNGTAVVRPLGTADGFSIGGGFDHTSATAVEGLTVRGGNNGILVRPGTSRSLEPRILANRLEENQVGIRVDASLAHGLAVPWIERNTILSSRQAGVLLDDAGTNCGFGGEGDVSARFSANRITGCAGPGVAVNHQGDAGAPPLTFEGDRIEGNGGGVYVGACWGAPRKVAMTNCEITRNLEYGFLQARLGPGEYGSPLNFALLNSTVADNAAGGIRVGKLADVSIRNSILWGHPDDLILIGEGCDPSCGPEVRISWSDAADTVDGYRGPGNFSAAPLFVSRGAGDYHLTSGSPCVDAATSDALDWDPGEPPLAVPLVDREGRPRVDIGSAPNRGGGAFPWYDLGSLEYQPSGAGLVGPGEPPDADADGVADAFDCAPADAAVWAPPGPVEGLLIARGADAEALLAWTPQPGALYDVASGDLADLAAGLGTRRAACVASGLSAPSWADRRGGAAYYLVRARNACGPWPEGGPEFEGAFASCRQAESP